MSFLDNPKERAIVSQHLPLAVAMWILEQCRMHDGETFEKDITFDLDTLITVKGQLKIKVEVGVITQCVIVDVSKLSIDVAQDMRQPALQYSE